MALVFVGFWGFRAEVFKVYKALQVLGVFRAWVFWGSRRVEMVWV